MESLSLMSQDYQSKYQKYKQKYRRLQQLLGGSESDTDSGYDSLLEPKKFGLDKINQMLEDTTITFITFLDHHMGDEGAAAIAEKLGDNKNLISLDLTNNDITFEGAKQIAESLKQNKVLQGLNLDKNDIGPKGIRALGMALIKNNVLKALIVSSNNLGNKSIRALNKSFSTTQDGISLMALNINDNKIGLNGIRALAQVLPKMPALIELNISNNKIGNKSLEILANSFAQQNQIKFLELEHNNIGSRGIESFSDFLVSNKTLRELSISNNKIRNKGAIALARALEKNTTLQDLDIAYNHISKKGGAKLAESLLQNNTLNKLTLRNNQIRGTGTLPFQQLLENNQTLTHLDIAENKIRDTGAKALALGLKSNQTLKYLYLERNNIKNSGAVALAEALRENTGLKTLNLLENQIGNKGAKALAKALQKNKSSLVNLDLSDNNIQKEGGQAFINTVQHNKTIRFIFLQSNPGIDRKTIETIQKILDSESISEEKPQQPPRLSICEGRNDTVETNPDGEATLIKCSYVGQKKTDLINLIRDSKSTLQVLDLGPDTTLRYPRYNQHLIDNNFMWELKDFLTNNTTLTTLNLAHTSIGEYTEYSIWQILLDSIFTSDNNLTSLDLSNTLSHIGIELFSFKCDNYQAQHNIFIKLQKLSLSGNIIDWPRVSGFLRLPTLEELDLSSSENDNWNQVVAKDLSVILREQTRDGVPLAINLRGNKIGDNTEVKGQFRAFSNDWKNHPPTQVEDKQKYFETQFKETFGYKTGDDVVELIIDSLRERVAKNKSIEPIGVITLAKGSDGKYLDGIDDKKAKALQEVIEELLTNYQQRSEETQVFERLRWTEESTDSEYHTLYDKSISATDLEKLMRAIQQKPTITYLKMSNPELDDDSVSKLTEALQKPGNHIETLALDGTDISVEGAEALAKALTHDDCLLTTLELDGVAETGAGGRIAKALADVLKSPKCQLKKLDLSNNQIGLTGVNALAHALISPDCLLTKLYLNNTGIGYESARASRALAEKRQAGFEALVEALKSPNSQLTRLDLRHNNIKNKGAVALAEALKSPHSQLTRLDLRHNEIGNEGAIAFANGLKDKNCKLTELDLTYYYVYSIPDENKIDCVGATALAEALQSPNCQLTKLNLGSHQIRNKGAIALAEALKSPYCLLTRLDLENNEIVSGDDETGPGDDGVRALAEALKDPNCRLTSLNLKSQGYVNAFVLAEALQHENCKLTELNLSTNHIDDDGALALAKALKNINCELTELDLSNNDIENDGALALAEALQHENSKLTKLYLFNNYIDYNDEVFNAFLKGIRHSSLQILEIYDVDKLDPDDEDHAEFFEKINIIEKALRENKTLRLPAETRS